MPRLSRMCRPVSNWSTTVRVRKPSGRAGDAEGVALRVGQHHPAGHLAERVPLGLARAGSLEPLDLGLDVALEMEVQVQPVLAGRRIVDLLEAQVRAFGE